jgi:putative GTP pyrophosphokinase
MNDSRAADDAAALQERYRSRYERVLLPLGRRLDTYLREVVRDYPRIDRISVRAKAVDRFLEKATRVEDSKPKYTNPLNQIQDQVGARIVTFYLSDVRQIGARVEDFFGSIEVKHVIPDSPREFGYEGKHYILFIPQDVMNPTDAEESPTFFELQIKTLFQHAWGEADHDLIYKPVGSLTADQRRRVAFTAAQAWGADRIFEELAQELNAPTSPMV